MKEFLTACPRNCYSTCSFIVHVDGNRIKRILPDPNNKATPEGPCLKGLSYMERAASEKRITTPLLRTESGSFKEIDCEQALDLLSGRITDCISRHGPKSILYYTGSGMSGLTNEIGYNFFKSIGGATTTYGNFCWPAGLEAVRLTFGEIKHNVPWDIENAGLIVAWGKNPAETNIQEMAFIDAALDRGAGFIVVDPRKTPTSDKADILLRPKPGTDAAVALAMAKVIVDNDLVDTDFINRHVKGYEEFCASLTVTTQEAENISGIPAIQIERTAQIIASTENVTFLVGYGMQRFTNGGQTVRSLISLAVITGNIGRPGTGFNYANLQGYLFDKYKEPLSYYPDINPDSRIRREISVAKLGEDMLRISDPELRMAIVERGNPLTQAPDTNLVEKAFQKLDFVVVIDQFMTDTAILADLILPAKNMFEQQDIISSYWSPYVYFRPKILDPPENILPESEIYYHLAKKMGIEINPEEIPSPGKDALDKWLEDRIMGFSPLSLDNLKMKPGIAHGLQEIAYSDFKFKTPSGLIELLSYEAVERWNVNKLPTYEAVEWRKNGAGFHVCFMSPNTKYRIHSQFGNLEVIRMHDPEPSLQVSVEDAAMLKIRSGDRVELSNDRGNIVLPATVTRRMIKGCVALPNGWWKQEGGGGNQLSAGRETDMGWGTAFHDTSVSIRKYE